MEHLVDDLSAVSLEKMFTEGGSVVGLAELTDGLLAQPDGGVDRVDPVRQVAVGPLLVLEAAGQAGLELLPGHLSVFPVELSDQHLSHRAQLPGPKGEVSSLSKGPSVPKSSESCRKCISCHSAQMAGRPSNLAA